MAHIIDGSGNSSTFPDIHGQSDGKLFHYGIKSRFSIDEKQKLINGLIDLVRRRANHSIMEFGVQALSTISRDVGQEANWQGPDGIFADDLLADICELIVIINDNEIVDTAINHLCEQFADMIRTGGWCPTGRCSRIFQVYMILRDYYDGVHQSPDSK